MNLRKAILSIIIIGMICVLLPQKAYAIMPVREYNPTSVLISKTMEIVSIGLGIAYPIFAVIYLIKTKEKKTKIQQMKTLIAWLIVTVAIVITKLVQVA